MGRNTRLAVRNVMTLKYVARQLAAVAQLLYCHQEPGIGDRSDLRNDSQDPLIFPRKRHTILRV
jgi:hypothetical protein